MNIPFNKPFIDEVAFSYIKQCLEAKHLSGDGQFTRRCHDLLNTIYDAQVLLMHSCTAALEAAAILSDITRGDEVIMPSFTFVSTANAVVLRGAIPVFIDIRPDTLNIDENLIIDAITDRTRIIMPMHYAGVGCEMKKIMEIAHDYNLIVIEDAAQCFNANYNGRPLGAFGDMGCISFHETKNVICGEGGALIVNNPELVERATYIREKGTNRTQYLRGEIAKYEWIDMGSSYLPSDLLAAILLSQLERGEEITKCRLEIWHKYHTAFQILEADGLVTRPPISSNTEHNGHIYYLLGYNPTFTREFIKRMKADGIGVTTHYVPLHSSPAGKKFSRTVGDLSVTDRVASTLFRLPVFFKMEDEMIDYVIERTFFHAHEISTGI